MDLWRVVSPHLCVVLQIGQQPWARPSHTWPNIWRRVKTRRRTERTETFLSSLMWNSLDGTVWPVPPARAPAESPEVNAVWIFSIIPERWTLQLRPLDPYFRNVPDSFILQSYNFYVVKPTVCFKGFVKNVSLCLKILLRSGEPARGSDSLQRPEAEAKQDVSLLSLLLFMVELSVWWSELAGRIFQGVSIFSPLVLQKAVRHHISGSLPAAVWSGCFLPVPSLHWCHLCRSQVCLRLLRPGEENRLSHHYSESTCWLCVRPGAVNIC